MRITMIRVLILLLVVSLTSGVLGPLGSGEAMAATAQSMEAMPDCEDCGDDLSAVECEITCVVPCSAGGSLVLADAWSLPLPAGSESEAHRVHDPSLWLGGSPPPDPSPPRLPL